MSEFSAEFGGEFVEPAPAPCRTEELKAEVTSWARIKLTASKRKALLAILAKY